MSLNGQNNTQNILQSYLNRLQERENESFYLLSCMSIGGAFGDLLNKLGNLVGEARLGRSDADYQAGIRLRIRVNNSSGRASDVLAVSMLASLSSVPQYLEVGVASFLVEMLNLPSAAYVADKLKHTRAAGTYGLMQYTPVGATSPLVLDSGYGSDVPNAGLLDSGYGSDVASPGESSAAFPI